MSIRSRVAVVCLVMTDALCRVLLVVLDDARGRAGLSAGVLWELHAMLVEGGFGEPGRRELLLAGLPPVMVAQLPVFARPNDQLWSDLCQLNRVDGPGECALSVYLHNAAGAMGLRAPRRLRDVLGVIGEARSRRRGGSAL